MSTVTTLQQIFGVFDLKDLWNSFFTIRSLQADIKKDIKNSQRNLQRNYELEIKLGRVVKGYLSRKYLL